jgi:hypothetical protein
MEQVARYSVLTDLEIKPFLGSILITWKKSDLMIWLFIFCKSAFQLEKGSVYSDVLSVLQQLIQLIQKPE